MYAVASSQDFDGLQNFDIEGEIKRLEALDVNLRSEIGRNKNTKLAVAEVDKNQRSLKRWQNYQSLMPGMPVCREGKHELGIVSEKNLQGAASSPLPGIFVKWDGANVPMPEQPELLEIDVYALSEQVRIGDAVKIKTGTSFEIVLVQRVLARGLIAVDLAEKGEIYKPSEYEVLRGDFRYEDFVSIVVFDQKVIGKEVIGETTLSTLKQANAYLLASFASTNAEKARPVINLVEQEIKNFKKRKTALGKQENLQAAKILDFSPNTIPENIPWRSPVVDEILLLESKDPDKIAQATKLASDNGLFLLIDNSLGKGWLVLPSPPSEEKAALCCPADGDRVWKFGGTPAQKFGVAQPPGFRWFASSGEWRIAIDQKVLWDDGSSTTENGYLLECIPPILQFLQEGEEKVPQENFPGGTSSQEAVFPESFRLEPGIYEVLTNYLKPYPLNTSIYGEIEDDSDLYSAIATTGWVKPLLANTKGEVLGGNRRLRVANKLGLEKLLVEVRDFPSKAAEMAVLLADNEVRDKSREQRVREGIAWKKIVEELKSEGKSLREIFSNAFGNQESFPDKKLDQSRDAIAARVGLGSGKNYQKAEKCVLVADEIREKLPDLANKLMTMLNEHSVDIAHTLASQIVAMSEMKAPAGWKPEYGERVMTSLNHSTRPGVSGIVQSEKAHNSVAAVVLFPGSERESVYVSQLIPESAPLSAAQSKKPKKQTARQVEALQAKELGLAVKRDGSLLPEAPRNEGIVSNQIAATPPINTPHSEHSNVMSTALAISSPIVSGQDTLSDHLAETLVRATPEEIKLAIQSAASRLSTAHFEAMQELIASILEARYEFE